MTRVQSARINGSLGGVKASQSLTEDQREERARKAGLAILNLYGTDYYTFLRHSRKTNHHPSAAATPVKISNAAKRLARLRLI